MKCVIDREEKEQAPPLAKKSQLSERLKARRELKWGCTGTIVGFGKTALWGVHQGLASEQDLAGQNRGRWSRVYVDGTGLSEQ